jgi:resuscitation-promoting factor RpfB
MSYPDSQPPARVSWLRALPTWGKLALIGAAGVLLLCVIGTIGALALPDEPRSSDGTVAAADAAESPSPAPSTAAAAETAQSQAAQPLPTDAVPPSPTVEKRTVTETRAIPFKTTRVSDPTLAKGSTRVKTAGRDGVKTLTYEVTYTNGAESSRKLIREVVTRNPVTQVVLVGTKVSQQCDPNYSGCVPIASDVDCAGSGDGPAYVHSPVEVIGSDIYDLDPDGNGVGCDT